MGNQESGTARVTVADVRRFWEQNPLSAAAIPHEPGTREFFECHTRLRDAIEPPELQARIYEWQDYRDRKVLDVGCGNGFVVALYARGGADVTGVDLTSRAIELTRKRLGYLGLQARLRQANAEELPFADASFDLVTSFGVLHHTPDTAKAIGEVYRVLKPGGKTIMMFYHRNSFAYRVLFPAKRLLQPSWRGKTAQDQVNAVDGMDNPLGKVYSRADLRNLLNRFERLEFATASLFFRWEPVLPAFVVRPITARWGWFLYVKAHKPVLTLAGATEARHGG
jgi:ubiquinone/menaquinone biosynthesis C-methylase UbiE